MRQILFFAIGAMVLAGIMPRVMGSVGKEPAADAQPVKRSESGPQATSYRTMTVRADARGHFQVEGSVDGRRLEFEPVRVRGAASPLEELRPVAPVPLAPRPERERIDARGLDGVPRFHDLGDAASDLALRAAEPEMPRDEEIARAPGDHVLFERGGALVSKEELAARVWPELEGQVSDANVEQLIARLRRKLDGGAAHPPLLLTVRGLGYRLVLP